MTNIDPNILYMVHSLTPGRQIIPLHIGDKIKLERAYAGTTGKLPDGREVRVVSSGSSTTLVRFLDDQKPIRIDSETEITVLSYDTGTWGLYPIGTTVQIEDPKSPYRGKWGIVVRPGLNSAHVVVPGVPKIQKVAERNMWSPTSDGALV